jgi:hypothetical protein
VLPAFAEQVDGRITLYRSVAHTREQTVFGHVHLRDDGVIVLVASMHLLGKLIPDWHYNVTTIKHRKGWHNKKNGAEKRRVERPKMNAGSHLSSITAVPIKQATLPWLSNIEQFQQSSTEHSTNHKWQ